LRKLGSFYTRFILLCNGYIYIKESRKKDINWAKYPKIQKSNQKAPIVITNHTSCGDIMYALYKYTPSFISSIHVKKMPIIGNVACGLECIFLDRLSLKSKEATLNAIVEKVEHIQQSPGSAPLLIFPEGVTGKAGYIKPFKRGAFYPLAPIMPIFIKYTAISFSSSYFFFDMLDDIILTLSQPFQHMDVQHLPTIEPNTTDYNEYCNEVYNLYKNEFGMTSINVDIKERDVFVHRILSFKYKL
jgi:1-acyl-sn-glycerol-3-phosphate acyltransferase